MPEAPERKLNPMLDDPATILRDVMSGPAIEALAVDVIKRLSARRNAKWSAPPDQIEKFCEALIARDPADAYRMIDDLVTADVPLEQIYSAYLAEAARELGARWHSNDMTFEAVGQATTRIYLILDDLRRRMPSLPASDKVRIAFAAVPGEQHTLGVEMAVDLFRRNGWDATHLIAMTHDQILEAATDPDIALIGLSASGRRRRAALLRLVVALRVVRPDLKILLSGAITNSVPDMIAQIGIDAIVRDVPQALHLVQRLVGRSPR